MSDAEILKAEDVKRANPAVSFMTHCMETEGRKKIIFEKYGKSSIEVFGSRELLQNALLFHGVHVSDQDIEIVRSNQASIVTCPTSTLSVAPIAKMIRAGVNVALGTDWGSTRYWELLRTIYKVLKLQSVSKSEFSAVDVVKMATRNGTEALRKPSVGLIEDGKQADLIFLKLPDTCIMPQQTEKLFPTLLHNILFETDFMNDVHHVLVSGKFVIRDRRLVTMNEREIEERYLSAIRKAYL